MATGNISLLDVAGNLPEGRARGAIETYALSSHPLSVMPLEDAPGGTKKWSIQNQLAYSTSAAGYRNLDAEFTATKAKKQPFASNIKIAGGRFKLDRKVKSLAPATIEEQRRAQLAANANILTKDIFEGANVEHYAW